MNEEEESPDADFDMDDYDSEEERRKKKRRPPPKTSRSSGGGGVATTRSSRSNDVSNDKPFHCAGELKLLCAYCTCVQRLILSSIDIL